MSITVFWLEAGGSTPNHVGFADTELSEALALTQSKRKIKGVSHVCISSELSSSVGLPGVNAVVDGKNPDGSDYTWSKKHRGRR